MKKLQSILRAPSIQSDIEQLKGEICGSVPDKNIDEAINNFFEDIVRLMEVHNWGTFYPNTENWSRDLLDENMDFYKKMGVEENIRDLDKKMNDYLISQGKTEKQSVFVLISLVSKVMKQSRFKIHNIVPQEEEKTPLSIKNHLSERRFEGIQ